MSIGLIILSYLAVGAVAGTMAGVFGIGGGLVIVPALMLAFAEQNVSADVAMHLAVGTSLATIAVTGASSAWGHIQRGSVKREWFFLLLPGLVIGAVAGVFIAGRLSGGVLGKLFGIFLIVIALRVVIGFKPKPTQSAPTPVGMGAAGAVIGGVSALFGIGGGTLSVPWLSRCGAPLPLAVGTSSACGMPIALVGAVSFAIVGWGHPSLPEWSLGYIMWPAFICLALTSVPFARLGVILAHSLPPQLIRLSFGGVLLIVGLRFLL
ncbi:sulfite exporter TauE/SafE family protein [Thauera humireducens]|uniref:Probable membrane transporter protein n=1 Tax=Thauera humireducens TaxID=1134435 RepID=A0A127K7Y3_9RHOO|nr:sulfite exporter TauE/SafE family protein [Thauera humireducens]AMO38078.1 hypothetical protein AC731_014695 [Thauera humireducens]